jgi:hypothetical protein
VNSGAPRWYDVVLGCLAVMVGSVGAATAFWFARHNRNWLFHVVGAGAALFVIGVVGQRAPSVVTGRPASLWDAAVGLPVVPIAVNDVALVGMLTILAGLSAVLFLERVVPPEQRWQPSVRRALEDDDSV